MDIVEKFGNKFFFLLLPEQASQPFRSVRILINYAKKFDVWMSKLRLPRGSAGKRQVYGHIHHSHHSSLEQLRIELYRAACCKEDPSFAFAQALHRHALSCAQHLHSLQTNNCMKKNNYVLKVFLYRTIPHKCTSLQGGTVQTVEIWVIRCWFAPTTFYRGPYFGSTENCSSPWILTRPRYFGTRRILSFLDCGLDTQYLAVISFIKYQYNVYIYIYTHTHICMLYIYKPKTASAVTARLLN